MQIHVVNRGESLWSLSRRYGVSAQRLQSVNGIGPGGDLVVGQALIIPGNEITYRVRPNDSLYSIARRFNVSVSSIVELNNITNPSSVTPGTILRIPESAQFYGYIESNGFIIPTSPAKETATLSGITQYLTYLSPFANHAREDGTLEQVDDSTILQIAKSNRAAPLMVITNIKGANFDTDLAHTILTNDTVQNNLINNVLQTMRSKGFYGLIVDFERISPDDKTNYINFLRKITRALHAENHIIGSALAPKTTDTAGGAWYAGHDYRAVGEVVDFAIIMTYEWGWSGGPPMAVAPVDQVRKVLEYAISRIPPKKVMMGQPLYGYDWTLPYVQGGKFAEAIGMEEAVRRALIHGAEIKFDWPSRSPFFNYRDSQGKDHVVWYEDARTIQAKYVMLTELGLRGVSYWSLAQPFSQNWYILNNMFKITKVVRS